MFAEVVSCDVDGCEEMGHPDGFVRLSLRSRNGSTTLDLCRSHALLVESRLPPQKRAQNSHTLVATTLRGGR